MFILKFKLIKKRILDSYLKKKMFFHEREKEEIKKQRKKDYK